MATKKVALVIVEGISDVTSIDRYLRMLKTGTGIFYHIVRGDITKEKGMARNTAKKILGDAINKYIKNNTDGIKKTDIKEVVHIVDLDGAFIDSELVIKDESALDIRYGDTDIHYCYNEYLAEKNNQKAGVLDVLSSTDYMCKTLPYSIYFFSRNIEHALHGDRRSDISDSEKRSLSEMFAFKFRKIDEFVKFMNSEEVKSEGETYGESWRLIKDGTNSLKRSSNFHFYINNQLR
ncbi:MAG: hypothetical protein RSC84_06200 [Peptostreptococcaceae bacterium]